MRLAGFLAVALLVLCACSTPDAPRDGGDQTMPVSAQTAADFGDVALPPGVRVLGTDTDSGRDTRYRLALRMTDSQLGDLLAQFSAAPRPSEIPKSTPVIAGPELSTAPDPRYAQ